MTSPTFDSDYKLQILQAEMTTCYVCLENCLEKSPCKCQIPIHHGCMSTMQQKIPDLNCTICRTPLNLEVVKPYTSVHLFRSILKLFLLYLLLGWIGKCMLYLAGMKMQHDFLFFWTIEHCICAVTLALFIVLVRWNNIHIR